VEGLDYLGAVPLVAKPRVSWSRAALALAAGTLGAFVFRRSHPVLAFIGTAAVASNTHAVVVGDRTLRGAVRRIGCHVVATAGSLALPSYPAIGYVAGAIAGDLLLDGEGGGIVEELTHKNDDKVIEAEIVETKPGALATASKKR
jgi:hypothetical protein